MRGWEWRRGRERDREGVRGEIGRNEKEIFGYSKGV